MALMDKIHSILAMGHMKTWWVFGFEWWGTMKPAGMTTAEGITYIPLFCGLWIRCDV
jgi:hypothetical protein